MDIVPTIMVLYLWCTCRGQSHSPIFTVSIFSTQLRPCLLSIFFGKYTVCSLSLTLKVTFPLLQSIIAPAVLRKMSTKNNGHAPILGHVKHNKICKDQAIS